jgi:DUF1365 family protein
MRTEPRYYFSYGAFYLDLNLAELADIDECLWLFSHNGLNLLSLRDNDYLGLDAEQAAGQDRSSTSLVTQPRVLNYAFNPVSFFLSRDATDIVSGVVAEVHNTWDERHLYRLDRNADTRAYRSGASKSFYVSPFMDMDGRYEFRLKEEPNRLRLRIDEYRDSDRPFFRAGMDLAPLPLTSSNLMRMLARYPLVTLKTIGAIHWHGLKLWLRHESFRPNPGRARPHGTRATP